MPTALEGERIFFPWDYKTLQMSPQNKLETQPCVEQRVYGAAKGACPDRPRDGEAPRDVGGSPQATRVPV